MDFLKKQQFSNSKYLSTYCTVPCLQKSAFVIWSVST